MLNNKRVQTDAEELLGLRGKRANHAVRFRDLDGLEFTRAVSRIAGDGDGGDGDGPGGGDPDLTDLEDRVRVALEAANQAAEAAQNANIAAGLAQDYADGLVAEALANIDGRFTTMSNEFALMSEAEGRDFSCINDTFLVSSDWTRSSSQGVLTTLSNQVFPIGRTWQFQVTAAQQDGVAIIDSPISIWPGQTNAGGYVVELMFTPISGTLNGAGVRLEWRNTAGTAFAVNMRLDDMQAGVGTVGRARVAQAVFVKPAGFSGTFASHRLFVMANLNAWTMAAKTIQFHRINIRPATQEEMGSGQVMASVQAHLTENYLTAASTNAAIASYDMTLNASLQTTLATVQRTSTAIASLNGSVARFRDVVSINGENAAGIEAVSFSGTGAGAGSVLKLIGDQVIAEGTLSAGRLVVHDGSGNIFPDPTFQKMLLTAWSGGLKNVAYPVKISALSAGALKTNAPAMNALFVPNHAGDGTLGMSGPKFSADPGQEYNLGFDLATGGQHRIALILQFMNNEEVAIGTRSLVVDSSPTTWVRHGVDVVAPAGTVEARIHIQSIDNGLMNTGAFITNFTVIRKRSGATLITPFSVTSREVNTVDFNAAGLAVFGGTLMSDNYSAANGTGWRLTKAGTMNLPFGIITNAHIGNTIQSDDYVTGDNGQGWRIQKSGAAEFNNIKIRRQLQIAQGSVDIGNFTPADTIPSDISAGTWGYRTGDSATIQRGPQRQQLVLATGVPITEWMGARKTYIANAGMTGTVSSGDTANCYWGWTADVMPLTKWSGNQTLRLLLSFWCQRVVSVQNCVVSWKIYEVS